MVFPRTFRLLSKLSTRRNFLLVTTASLTSATLLTTTAASYIIHNDSTEDPEKPTEPMTPSWKERLLSRLLNREHVQIKPEPESTTDGTVHSELIHTIQRKQDYRVPKNPIILCHGLSGFDRIMVLPSLDLIFRLIKGDVRPEDFVSLDDSQNGSVSLEYWYGIEEELRSRGCEVFVAKVPGFGSIEERSERLNEFIKRQVEKIREEKSKEEVYNDSQIKDQRTLKQTGEKLKVNLVAHSMGGLDSRYLIDTYDQSTSNYQIVSLTTITTPHRGSEMADFVVNLVKDAPLIPQSFKLPTCLYQLTTSHMAEFNKVVKDSPEVQYFSYGACFKPEFYNIFYATWNIIADKAGENDGMVAVKSAKWGTYLGTLVNCDHLDIINWTGVSNLNIFRWPSEKLVVSSSATEDVDEDVDSVLKTEEAKGIDTIALYLDIADNLAGRGL
ncbi:hypothetical protein WICPIJ_005993 [Wickerhamomyces pijperi]|uniref:AB hydrolase-1 domain-containing protein n=1 Tax=Wickerhamomyces pijperi TaxID=599730 RepID=A0A9P8Q584_WICPI|nr:hypothetical protein WICPIJ_005993 [Wickerhamomyces pijperi]